MTFLEKDWKKIIENTFSNDPYAVNHCFSELSLIPDSPIVDEYLQHAHDTIQPDKRMYSRYPDCLSPFGLSDPVYDDQKLKKYYCRKCKNPIFYMITIQMMIWS